MLANVLVAVPVRGLAVPLLAVIRGLNRALAISIRSASKEVRCLYNRVEYRPVNLEVVQDLADKLGCTTINKELLIETGYASAKDLVKILGCGEVRTALTVEADAFSKKAEEAITAAGGSAVEL